MPQPGTDRRQLGQHAEEEACAFLAQQGCRILLRNYRRRTGELDVVACDGAVLVVAEVRLRSREDYGGAAASVDGLKRARIVRTTQQLLQQHRALARMPVRFDVLIVHGGGAAARVEWLRHAFEA